MDNKLSRNISDPVLMLRLRTFCGSVGQHLQIFGPNSVQGYLSWLMITKHTYILLRSWMYPVCHNSKPSANWLCFFELTEGWVRRFQLKHMWFWHSRTGDLCSLGIWPGLMLSHLVYDMLIINDKTFNHQPFSVGLLPWHGDPNASSTWENA